MDNDAYFLITKILIILVIGSIAINIIQSIETKQLMNSICEERFGTEYVSYQSGWFNIKSITCKNPLKVESYAEIEIKVLGVN